GASGQLRNYPLQPRYPARNLARDTASQLPKNSQRPTQGGARRNLSTRSLAQHRSDALRRARQEAQSQQAGDRTRTRHSQEVRSQFVQRSRSSQHLSYSPGAQRPLDDDMPPGRPQRTQFAWQEEETFVDDPAMNQLYDSSQHYPRRPSYPRQPRARRTRAQEQADRWRTSEVDEDDQDGLQGRQARRDADRVSGSLRNPLVRRAPYLYDDDPLREEFAQQIDSERPIIRRSSLHERYQDDEEY
ncbi:MAG TPA: hypothetical protein VFV38_46540, partial [Ktedonobacteraceae bacterium]|nr:hypothetical protein [Ktedonobacteraceae bacterium]